MESKTDKLIWYVMITAMGIIIVGGGAWATNINEKAERIVALEVNLQYIQSDISIIKKLLQKAVQ